MIEALWNRVVTEDRFIFARKELENLGSADRLNHLMGLGILRCPAPDKDSLWLGGRCPDGAFMEILEIDGFYYGFCRRYPSVGLKKIAPVDQGLGQYEFQLERFLKHIKRKSLLRGTFKSLGSGRYEMGSFLDHGKPTVFIYWHERNPDWQQILGFREDLYPQKKMLLFFPVYHHSDAGPPQMGDDKTICLPFGSFVNWKTLRLDWQKLKASAGVGHGRSAPPDNYPNNPFAYKRMVRILIDGKPIGNKTYRVVIDGETFAVGPKILVLLLRFVLELKKGEGGWIQTSQLINEGYLEFSNQTQTISRLRENLGDKKSKTLIENMPGQGYRLSVPPEWVRINDKNLILFKDQRIKSLLDTIHNLESNK